MTAGTNIAEIAALVGDPARANMLDALLDGRALTAGELAYAAHVTASTASGHLAKLTEAGLLGVVRQGRHRYFRLASPRVAQMLESIMAVAALQGAPRYRPRSARDDALRLARTCYDHLAGVLGVGLADTLVARAQIVLTEDGGTVTEAGIAFLSGFGIDEPQDPMRRVFCRPCLDFTERRPHLAGRLGAALARRCFEQGWIERLRDSRAVRVTAPGRAGLAEAFGLDLAAK
jgi:DNA-binding transcriptional ArsR family regulator